jgi:hypothetical protein
MFCGTMNPAFRQIGNAVPPLMAKALAESIRSSLSTALERVVDAKFDPTTDLRAISV